MSEYTVTDFQESLRIVGISPNDIAEVVAAHGENGSCAEWDGESDRGDVCVFEGA